MNDVKNYMDDIPVKIVSERIGKTIRGIAKMLTNDVVSGKKTLEEVLRDLENSEIPDVGKRYIIFHIGLMMPTDMVTDMAKKAKETFK